MRRSANVTFMLCFLSLNDAFYVFFGLLGDHAVESEQCHNIRERHKAIDDVGKRPHEIDLQVRTGENGQNVQHTVHQNRHFFIADKILQALFRRIVPAENGGKSKEHKADHKKKCAEAPLGKPL